MQARATTASEPAAASRAAPRAVPARRRAAPAARPSSVPVRVTRPGDRVELQAERFARGGPLTAPAGSDGLPLGPARGSAAMRGVAGTGSALEPRLRRAFETRLGIDLGPVRIHTGADAAGSAHALRAKAYTYGSHIAFAANRYGPDTPAGQMLLAHELAHVAQQAGGVPIVARDFDASDVIEFFAPEVTAVVRSQGISGRDLLYGVAVSMFGETVASLIREWLGGFEEGLENAPADQVDRLNRKMDDFGPGEFGSYLLGYLLGILEGLWHGIRGLVEAIITLLRLPQMMFDFLTSTLPSLLTRYGPRLIAFFAAGGGIEARLARVRAAFLRDPRGSVALIERLVDQARASVLAMVRRRGRSAATSFLSFLEESWSAIGERFGDIVGQILFEVILALATDLIGNIVREAAQLGARFAARVVGPVVDGVRAIGRLAGQALEWVQALGRRIAGEAGELLEALRDLLREFRALFEELGPEIETAGAGPVRPPAPPRPPIAGATEVTVTPAEYEAALTQVFPVQYLNQITRAVDGIGSAAATRAVANPQFVAAVQNGNWALAGTLYHSAAAQEVRLLRAGSLPAGWRATAEEVIQAGRGGSRTDVLLRGPAGELIEFDWTTTGRSALSTGSRQEMTRHAGQITARIQGQLVTQESRSWVDFVRPLLPGVRWP